jgi:hypothetical protein
MSDILVSGLDISTAAAGFCTMDENGNLKSYDYYKFDKPDEWTNLDLMNQWEDHIWPHIENSDVVVLEDSLNRYRGGFSSRPTIVKLLQFNAVVEYELQRRLGKDSVIKLHPSTAKADSFLNRGRVPSDYESPWSTFKESKAWVIEEAEEYFNSFDYELTRSGNASPNTDDQADAIVLASAYVD